MAPFDPYYKWLGIAPEEQPANHYRLLGLRLFENDPEVIEAASDQRMAHLRTYQTGPYSALSQKLLNEVAVAKLCLLSPDKRTIYNETLRAHVPVASPAPASLAAAPLALPPMPPVGAGSWEHGEGSMQTPSSKPPAPCPSPPGYIAPLAPEPPPAAGERIDLDQLGVSAAAEGTAASVSGIGRRKKTESPWHDSQPASDKAEERLKAKKKRKHNGLVLLFAALALLLGLATAAVYLFKNRHTQPLAQAGQGQNDAEAGKARDSAAGAKVNEAPVLGGPNQGDVLPNSLPPQDVHFRWQPVANASSYWLQVNAPRHAKPDIDARDVQATGVTMKVRHLVPQGNCRGWTWRVKAKVDGQWTDWSAAHSFDFADPPAQAAQPEGNPLQQAQADPSPAPAEIEPAVPQAPAEVQAPPLKPKAVAKQPLPSDAARRQASEAMRQLYAKQYAAAKAPDERRALAGDMLRKADESGTDPATQYALMDRARAIAANCGDLLPALAIADHMARHFQTDAADLKRETLSDCLDAAPSEMLEDPAVGQCVLDVMGQLERAEQYDAAVKLGNQYCQRVRPTGKPAMLRQVSGELHSIHEAQAQQASGTQARNAIAANPDDPAACTALGRYRCLFQGDWRGGLPLLAKGNDAELRDLARAEQEIVDGGLEDNTGMSKLADAWYAQAEKEADHTVKSAMYRRARHWYEACMDNLSGMEKTKAKQRIDHIEQVAE